MGWGSGVDIFDAIAKALIENMSSQPESLKNLLTALVNVLEDNDWDTQGDSRYFDHPIVNEVFRKLHPTWKLPIVLTEKEISYLPCSSLMAIKFLKSRLKCSLQEARDAVYAHPKYKSWQELYSETCAKCETPISRECDTKCSECGEPFNL